MTLNRHFTRRARLRWWHHSAIIGALGVGAIYLVDYLSRGTLLYYAGPGDPLWLDDIIVSWHITFGTLLGLGIGVWIPKSLTSSRVGEPQARPSRAVAREWAGR